MRTSRSLKPLDPSNHIHWHGRLRYWPKNNRKRPKRKRKRKKQPRNWLRKKRRKLKRKLIWRPKEPSRWSSQ
jgi:hypothetical protein